MILTLFASLAVAFLSLPAAWGVRQLGRLRWRRASAVTAVLIVAGLTLPNGGLAAYLAWRWAAGQPASSVEPYVDHIPGCTLRHETMTVPNLAVIHLLRIEDAGRCSLVVTPPVDTPDGPRCVAMTATSAAATDTDDVDVKFFVNANFFTPFRDNWFLDYAPHAGDFVEPVGLAVSDGRSYGRPKDGWPSFWQMQDGTLGMGELPGGARNAVTGRQWLLKDGVVAVRQDEPPYPRTAVAMNANRTTLWLIVVDGKQPRYSDGLTLGELAKYLAKLGATDAIELDGGGSSTLTYTRRFTPAVVNRPCHTKIPGRQRPCGVFLGVNVQGRR